MQSASLSEIASFWASVATLWAAAGAWFTFYEAWTSNNETYYRGVANLIESVKTELSVIKHWASGAEGDPGYLKCDDDNQLLRQHPDWADPTRVIHPFSTPVIANVTNSPYVTELGSVIPGLIRLDLSIRALFNVYNELRQHAMSQPQLLVPVARKIQQPPGARPPFTPEEQAYIGQVFAYNRRIHQDLIGGRDSTNLNCLYNSFRAAEDSVKEFRYRPTEPPRWYWLMHALSTLFITGGIALVLQWFEVLPYGSIRNLWQ